MAKHAADIRAGFFDSERKRFGAVGVNEAVWRSGIDQERSSSVVDGNRNKQMIAESTLQFCTAETLLCEKPDQCAAVLLCLPVR